MNSKCYPSLSNPFLICRLLTTCFGLWMSNEIELHPIAFHFFELHHRSKIINVVRQCLGRRREKGRKRRGYVETRTSSFQVQSIDPQNIPEQRSVSILRQWQWCNRFFAVSTTDFISFVIVHPFAALLDEEMTSLIDNFSWKKVPGVENAFVELQTCPVQMMLNGRQDETRRECVRDSFPPSRRGFE